MSRPLLLVCMSMAAWGLGEGMFIYFQPIYLQQLGASPLVIGSILGLVGLFMAATQIPAGYLGDRFGRRPLIWASWILGTIATALMALTTQLGGFTLGLVLYGLTAFVMPPMNSYISNARGDWTIGRAITTVSAAYNLGAVVGPMIGGQLAELYGIRALYGISTGIFVVSTTVMLFIPRQPVESRQAEQGRFNLLRNPRFLSLTGVLFLTILATYLPYPLTSNFLLHERGLNLAQIGTLGSIGSLGNALLAITLGGIQARAGFLAGQAAALLAALLIWLGTGLPWYMLGYFFLGGTRICKSLSMALTRPLIHPSQMGVAYGVLETFSSLALIIAPVLAGWIYTQDPARVYPVAAAAIGLVGLVSLRALPRVRRDAEELIITPERE